MKRSVKRSMILVIFYVFLLIGHALANSQSEEAIPPRERQVTAFSVEEVAASIIEDRLTIEQMEWYLEVATVDELERINSLLN